MIYSTDGSITEDHFLKKWYDICCTRGTAAGYSTQPGPQLEGWLKAAGFINVTVHRLPMPLGVWPKDKNHVSIALMLFGDRSHVNLLETNWSVQHDAISRTHRWHDDRRYDALTGSGCAVVHGRSSGPASQNKGGLARPEDPWPVRFVSLQFGGFVIRKAVRAMRCLHIARLTKFTEQLRGVWTKATSEGIVR